MTVLIKWNLARGTIDELTIVTRMLAHNPSLNAANIHYDSDVLPECQNRVL